MNMLEGGSTTPPLLESCTELTDPALVSPIADFPSHGCGGTTSHPWCGHASHTGSHARENPEQGTRASPRPTPREQTEPPEGVFLTEQ